MTTETVSLIVAGGSVLSALIVVGINSYVAFQTKKIDVQMKRDEHNRALRAIYIARKVETAEAAISKWNLYINHWTLEKNMFERISESPNYNYAESKRDIEMREMSLAKWEELAFKTHDPFRLFFDAEMFIPFDDERQGKIDLKRRHFINLLEQLRKIEMSKALADSEEDEFQEGYDAKCLEINGALAQVISLITQERQILRDACTRLSKHMSNYDIE